MRDRIGDVNHRIAARVREIRSGQRLSLDAAAERSGVSRSMISLIERRESSPTAVVLEKLARGLGVALPALFDAPTADGATPALLARRRDQPLWRDPDSGYVRRNVSPPGPSQRLRIVEVRFPAGARVAFENGGAGSRMHQQVWMLAGTMDVTVGTTRHRLAAGDCLAMALDRPTLFRNPTRRAARYAVVSLADDAARQR